jgi:fructose-bisphosphate aldolase class II
VNVTSTQTLNAAIRGFSEAGADGIVQMTTGGAQYVAGPAGDPATGARALALAGHALIAAAPVRIALHTDHCPPELADSFLEPLLAESVRRRTVGELPLFHSHMYDGSSQPLEENLRASRRWLAACRAAGTVLEMEVGVVGGEEDHMDARGVPPERLYTTSAELLSVAEALGTGERGDYLVAATFGNVHGIRPAGEVQLRPEILADGQRALARAHPGARFRYAFHGASGADPQDVHAAISHGVVKVNVDTDVQYAFTRAVAGHVMTRYDGVLRVDGGLGDKGAFDPRAWGRAAERSMATRVAELCELTGAAGRSGRA